MKINKKEIWKIRTKKHYSYESEEKIKQVFNIVLPEKNTTSRSKKGIKNEKSNSTICKSIKQSTS